MSSNVIPFRAPTENPSIAAQRELAMEVTIALRAIEKMEYRIANRPFKSEGRSIVLAEPACEKGCAACFMECAIAPSRLTWWEKELVAMGGIPSWMRQRDGVAEAR